MEVWNSCIPFKVFTRFSALLIWLVGVITSRVVGVKCIDCFNNFKTLFYQRLGQWRREEVEWPLYLAVS